MSLHVTAVARNGIYVTPAIAFAGPEKSFTAIDPFDVAARESGLVPIDVAPRDVYPRFVFFSQNWRALPVAASASITMFVSCRRLSC